MLVPGGLKVLGAYGAVAPGGGASQLQDAAQALLSSVPSQLVPLHVTPPIHSGPLHHEGPCDTEIKRTFRAPFDAVAISTDGGISDRDRLVKHGLIDPVPPPLHVNSGCSHEEARCRDRGLAWIVSRIRGGTHHAGG